MDWDEFLQVKKRHDPEDAPALLMSGVAGDNATRYLLKQVGQEFPNNQAIFDRNILGSRDFIWNGRVIRTGGMGGHPALAGFDTVYCAGRLEEGWFFFHSGHYHPKQIHALFFMVDFIENTCQDLAGVKRDTKVNELAGMKLRLYEDKSETITYDTTFAQAVNGRIPQVMTTSMSVGSGGIPRSSPMMIGSSSPISIGGHPTASTQPMPIGQQPTLSVSPKPVRVDESEVTRDLGINTYGRHQLQVRINGAPPWIDDSARTRCKICEAEFSIVTRKHHCRRCGDIVCAKCSSKTKEVKNPATKSGSKPETGKVRVCDVCYATADLL